MITEELTFDGGEAAVEVASQAADGVISFETPPPEDQTITVDYEGDTAAPARSKPEPKYIKRASGPNHRQRRALRKTMTRNFEKQYLSQLGKAGLLPPQPPSTKKRRKKHGAHPKKANRNG